MRGGSFIGRTHLEQIATPSLDFRAEGRLPVCRALADAVENVSSVGRDDLLIAGVPQPLNVTKLKHHLPQGGRCPGGSSKFLGVAAARHECESGRKGAGGTACLSELTQGDVRIMRACR